MVSVIRRKLALLLGVQVAKMKAGYAQNALLYAWQAKSVHAWKLLLAYSVPLVAAAVT